MVDREVDASEVERESERGRDGRVEDWKGIFTKKRIWKKKTIELRKLSRKSEKTSEWNNARGRGEKKRMSEKMRQKT